MNDDVNNRFKIFDHNHVLDAIYLNIFRIEKKINKFQHKKYMQCKTYLKSVNNHLNIQILVKHHKNNT
jgi:hypothetical protein